MQTNKQETYPRSTFKTTQHPDTMWTITLFQRAKNNNIQANMKSQLSDLSKQGYMHTMHPICHLELFVITLEMNMNSERDRIFIYLY